MFLKKYYNENLATMNNLLAQHPADIALTVSLSLVVIVLWGTLAGALIPFVLRKIGFDPATASSPFVATLVYVSGLIIYFTIAVSLLSGKLL